MTAPWFWTAVACRVFANPLSNVFQKQLVGQGVSPLRIICGVHGLLSLACLPAIVVGSPAMSAGFWSNLLVAAALAVACNSLLVAALARDDLSILGPINSFKPVVSLVPAIWLLGEAPGPLGMGGIALVAAGSYFLIRRNKKTSEAGAATPLYRRRGVQLRVAALVLSAVEAVFLKRALAASDPTTTFVGWCVVGFFLAAATIVIARRGRKSEASSVRPLRSQIAPLLLTAATTGAMQYSTLAVFSDSPVASALALFQLSSIVSVLLGHRIFREPHLARRLGASAIMAAGAALLVLDR